MINCLIIDDEQAAIDVLKIYIKNVPSLNLVAESLGPVEALEIVYTQKIDLIFIDIQMPELSGLDFIKLTKGRSKFILTTAYKQYALEGYEHNVVDYLLKPISFERFLQAIQKVQDLMTPIISPQETQFSISSKSEDYIFIKTDSRMQKVNFTEILYVEGLGNYVTIHTTKGKFVTLLNVKDLEENLPSDIFMRVHRSYIISLGKIEFVEGNQIFLDKDTSIPLGETYKNQLWAALDSKIISSKKS
jgi:two-component system, LytTR family, response regulator